MTPKHKEKHKTHHIGWLRAAVLGANDGIVSTASLIIGVAAAGTDNKTLLVAGVAGLVAGAMSMAAGEYVSVSSQADTERADLERERQELENEGLHELKELTHIYIERGLDAELARQVAQQLMQHDALAAHARDELGISEIATARPIQAAMTSATAFITGAVLPLTIVVLFPFLNPTTPVYLSRLLELLDISPLVACVALTSLLFLALLGSLSAYTGGASVRLGAGRVTLWGALAMIMTAAVGAFFEAPA
ncbi:MAG: VIT1/CCC1 transporter family protein [Gammaproteobacteria bacterium]